MGPVWDFDWAWKNIDECDIFRARDGSGWAYKVNACGNWPVAVTWMQRMLQDQSFADELHTRYTQLRRTILSEENLFGYIDSVARRVDYAQNRHYTRWPILGINVGTPEIDPQPDSYEGVIDQFKQWIGKRLVWLDQSMPGRYIDMIPDPLNPEDNMVLYPNPAVDRLFVKTSLSVKKIEIFSITGIQYRTVFERSGDNTWQTNISRVPKGIYFIRVYTLNEKVITGKFLKD